jgi:hypothetical protein
MTSGELAKIIAAYIQEFAEAAARIIQAEHKAELEKVAEVAAKILQSDKLSYETFYEPLPADDDGWEAYCLVQRIEPVRLSQSGKKVTLTLRASSGNDASIDRIYISRPDPAGPEYSSAADSTAVTTVPFVVPKGKSVTLSPIAYNLDEGQPLLIAVDFSASPASAVGCTESSTVPKQQAFAYYKLGAEAANQHRTGFTDYEGIYLIERIQVSQS